MKRVIFSVFFTAFAVRGQLRVARIRQDCDVHVDVHRGSVSAQYGNRYVETRSIYQDFAYIENRVESVTYERDKRMLFQKEIKKQRGCDFYTASDVKEIAKKVDKRTSFRKQFNSDFNFISLSRNFAFR